MNTNKNDEPHQTEIYSPNGLGSDFAMKQNLKEWLLPLKAEAQWHQVDLTTHL